MRTQVAPDELVGTLTIAELQQLITDSVRQALREQTQNHLASRKTHELPAALLATFGTWEDSRSAEEIAAALYDNRTTSLLEEG